MKKPKGLPEWFCLENYKDAESLTPQEWYENLYNRSTFFVNHRLSHSDNPKVPIERKEYCKARCKQFVDLIAEEPIVRVADQHKVTGIFGFTTVDSLRNGELVGNYQLLVENAPPVFGEYEELHNRSKNEAFRLSHKNETLSNFFSQKCTSLDYEKALIEVNMHASDEQIVEDFKNWLANTRRVMNKKTAKKRFSVMDFNEWAEYQILPYLDLKIWSLFSGCHLTQVMIGNALFPDELDIDTTERIRRTTKKKADWLMNHTVLDALGRQIKKERLENLTT
jgi:hypothetical protein